MDAIIQRLTDFAVAYGVKIIGAIVILIIGRIVAGIFRSTTKKLMTKAKVEQTLTEFIGNLSFYLIIAFTVVAALAKFGVETASFVAVLAMASFAVGFALQGSLSNFAAGVMILLFRPYKIGDIIEVAGILGAVKELHIFSTTINTPDNIKVIVPNSKIYGDTIKNYAGNATRRVDMVIGISYGSDIAKAIEVAMNAMKADQRVLAQPEPMVAVSELADSSVNLVVRPWVKKEDYWNVKFDVTRKIKEAFDKNGIEIPFPQRVVHMTPGSENQSKKSVTLS